jgi:hypothetical protein
VWNVDEARIDGSGKKPEGMTGGKKCARQSLGAISKGNRLNRRFCLRPPPWVDQSTVMVMGCFFALLP